MNSIFLQLQFVYMWGALEFLETCHSLQDQGSSTEEKIAEIEMKLFNLGKQQGISVACGKLLNSRIYSVLRFCNLKKLLGKSLRFLEPMANAWRAVRYPTDEVRANISIPC